MTEEIFRISYYIKLVVAHVFPRCKPNRIPDKMPENKMSKNGKPDKMPENKMSENGKPDKMPDSVCRLVRENCPTDLQNSFWEL